MTEFPGPFESNGEQPVVVSDDHDEVVAQLGSDLDEFEDGSDNHDEMLRIRLQQLLDPAVDIEAQTTQGIDRSLRDRSSFNMGVDLVGLGWTTLRVLLAGGDGDSLTNDRPGADRDMKGT